MPRPTAQAILTATLAAQLSLCSARADTTATVDQHDRKFDRSNIDLAAGDSVNFRDADPFAHQVYVSAPTFSIETDEQEPGSATAIRFPVAGDFDVRCRIHPRMLLHVHVH